MVTVHCRVCYSALQCMVTLIAVFVTVHCSAWLQCNALCVTMQCMGTVYCIACNIAVQCSAIFSYDAVSNPVKCRSMDTNAANGYSALSTL